VPPKPAARPKPGDKPDDNGLRVLTYLKLHWLMISFCGSLIGTAGAFAAWELLASKYESYALFQVSSVPTALGNQNANQARTEFSTYVKTTAALMKSEFVLNAALRDMKDVATIKAQPDPIRYLEEELMVNWQDGSEVVRITFKSGEPQDAKRIVDAVQNAFMREVVQKDVDEKRLFLKKVEDAQLDMKKVLLQATDNKQKTPGIVQTGGAAPGAQPAPPGTLPQDLINRLNPQLLINRLVQLQQQVDGLPNTIRHYTRQQTLIKEKLEQLQKEPVPQAVYDAVDRDQDVVTQKLRMVQALRAWEFHKAGGDPNAPGVLQFQSRYEAEKQRHEEIRQEKVNSAHGAARLAEAKKLAGQLETVVATIQQHQEQLVAAEAQLKKANEQLLQLPLPQDKAGGIMQAGFREKAPYEVEDTARLGADSIYGRLVQQYYLTQMELNSPPRVRILQPASHPVQKDVKKQVMGTALAGVMGFVLMAAGVIAYEMTTRRVSSLADVTATVPAPIVAVIPGEPGEAMGRDPVKRAAANEAVDKLRAYVSQTWLARGATTIAVTSPIGDEGKAFAAFGLASSLAQAGYKTLLVDFDLREPALHAYAGVANTAGVCELLRGETDMRAAVQFLPSGLHLLPSGKWSDEARKAATGEKLETLMARMKEPYDCVVLHGHALLTVAESVEVARRCEVVLVCARYRETATPLLKKAAERVATMEIPFTGVVYVGATEQEALC
jgi:Mrp family chromosome partitioning ATPase/capsular polysaccharide biosynthesis protein